MRQLDILPQTDPGLDIAEMNTTRTIALRFRDLNVELGGTIRDHSELIQQTGHVWWGWWGRPEEITPHRLFEELSQEIVEHGSLSIVLYDSGQKICYVAVTERIVDAPNGSRMRTPDPELTPDYYHRATCPAWFLLKSIAECNIRDMQVIVESFPTLLQAGASEGLVGREVTSAEMLCNFNVTLVALTAVGS